MFSQFYPPASAFVAERDIPDQTGKVVLVTGGTYLSPYSFISLRHYNLHICYQTSGNSGVGYETVKQLLLKNAKVYLAARDPFCAREAASKLKLETSGKEPVVLELDLSDLTSVGKAVEEFLSKESVLHVLYNNA